MKNQPTCVPVYRTVDTRDNDQAADPFEGIAALFELRRLGALPPRAPAPGRTQFRELGRTVLLRRSVMKAIMVVLFPLLILSYCLWWDHYHTYYERFYPESPHWRAFWDMWRNT